MVIWTFWRGGASVTLEMTDFQHRFIFLKMSFIFFTAQSLGAWAEEWRVPGLNKGHGSKLGCVLVAGEVPGQKL